MPIRRLAIKLDVDTLTGYLYGVPRLLDLFEEKRIPVSIFFSMGPDNSGKAIRRIFRKGFVKKMLRTRAPSTYGFKTLLYGTLLKAPKIVQRAPEILKRAAGIHDCGVHAWDHVLIQDHLGTMERDDIRREYEKAFELFANVTGKPAESIAAPGWQVTPDSLSVTDEFSLDYASDTRGKTPFYPEVRGIVYKTLQIPTTLSTMDEIMGLTIDRSFSDVWFSEMRQSVEVLTIHAEMEGRSRLKDFETFLDRVIENDISLVTLKDLAAEARGSAPVSNISPARIRGRAGEIVEQADTKEDRTQARTLL